MSSTLIRVLPGLGQNHQHFFFFCSSNTQRSSAISQKEKSLASTTPKREMAEISLTELLKTTKERIKNRKPNDIIIAQLTSGKERKKPLHQMQDDFSQPANSEVNLVTHITVDFIRGASIAIGILQQTQCPTTGTVISCGLEPSILKFGYQSHILQQAQLETSEEAQMFGLEFAIAFARETIRDRWPGDTGLGAVKFCIGLTGPVVSRNRVAELVSQHVRQWERNPEMVHEQSLGIHSVLEHISRLKAEMANRFGGVVKPIYFEDEQEQTGAYHVAKRKQKSLQSSPQWKKRWQRDPVQTRGQSRVQKIVQEYRARKGC
jgi:hypothetical protein